MKKIIAIISCIAVLSAVCVLSAFAYDRIDDIPLETLEISEREERTEENNGLRSIESISLNTLYRYISNRSSYSFDLYQTNTYQGHYKGTAYDGTLGTVDEYDVDFTQMRALSGEIALYTANNTITIKNTSYDFNGVITFTAIGNNTSANDYFKSTLNIYNPMDDVYNDSGDFLGFITDTLTDLVDYMITNNLILIVMAIVIVSFGIGVLIRITKVK